MMELIKVLRCSRVEPEIVLEACDAMRKVMATFESIAFCNASWRLMKSLLSDFTAVAKCLRDLLAEHIRRTSFSVISEIFDDVNIMLMRCRFVRLTSYSSLLVVLLG